ncbi:MAG: CBS domain-containing protein [Planctomycetota bacterium]
MPLTGWDVDMNNNNCIHSADLRVKDIMTKNIVSINEDSTIAELCTLMSQFKLSAIPVVDKEGILTGIISEKDIITHEVTSREPILVDSDLFELISSKYHDLESVHFGASFVFVEEIMTRNVVTITPEESVSTAAEIFCNSDFHRLPVVEDGKLVGILSSIDVLKALIRGSKTNPKDCE